MTKPVAFWSTYPPPTHLLVQKLEIRRALVLGVTVVFGRATSLGPALGDIVLVPLVRVAAVVVKVARLKAEVVAKGILTVCRR
jgi:hypothetical protein